MTNGLLNQFVSDAKLKTLCIVNVNKIVDWFPTSITLKSKYRVNNFI